MGSLALAHSQSVAPTSALLHAVIEHIRDPLYVKARDHRWVLCNQPLCQLVGRADDLSLMQRNLDQTLADEGRQLDEQVFVTGQSSAVETTVIDHQGEAKVVTIHRSRLQDERGTFYVLGTLQTQDAEIITPTQIEHALAESETRFHNLMSNLPAMIYRCCYDADWTMNFVSDFASDLTGYSAESFVNNRDRSWASIIHPEDRAHVEVEVTIAIVTRQPYQIEYRLRHQDGHLRWVLERGQAQLDQDGEVAYLDGVIFDITQHKQMIAALEQSELTNRALVGAIPDLLIRVRRDGVNLNVLTSGDIAPLKIHRFVDGSRVEDSLPLDLAQRRMAAIQAALATGEMQQYEQRLEYQGQPQYEEVRVVPCQADEALVIVRDISERKRLEAERQQTELELHRLNTELEARVTEGTVALQSSQRQLELLIQQTPMAVIEWDLDGKIQAWNPAAESMFGYSAAEVIGQTFERCVPPEEWPDVQQTFRTLLNQRTVITRVNENLTRNGHTILCEWHNSPLIDENESVVGIAAFAADITQRHQAEKEQAKLLAILEATPDFIGIADTQGQLLYINRAGKQILGLDTDAQLPNINRVLSPKSSIRLMQEGIPIALKQGIWRGENTLNSRTGQSIPISQVIVTHRDDTGQVGFLSTIGRDITERKQAENALRKSERRFRDISEAAGEYIWEIDTQGCYTFVTDKAKAVKGYWPSELIGHTPYEFMPPEDVSRVNAIIERAAIRRRSFRLEHRTRTPEGEIVWEEMSGVPQLDAEGEVIGFRGAGLSITERKRSEIALQQSELNLRLKAAQLEQAIKELQQTQAKMIQSEKMSSLGQLVAGVAHEINNPVNFIHGNLDYATAYTEDLLELIALYQTYYPEPVDAIATRTSTIDLPFLQQDLPKLLKSMNVGAQRIQDIVRSLRTFSRMDEAEVKAVDLHEGIDSTLMILQSRLKEQPNRPAIEVVFDYDTLPKVECYAGQMNQVFMNILVNAIDALEEAYEAGQCPQPQVTIQTRLIHLPSASLPQAVIGIHDNGPGIPEDIRNRLFDPFFTTKAIGKGTGMGLSISYQIITENHNGMVECLSEVGRGTEFRITIPFNPDVVQGITGSEN
ncbi:MAG: PAS domain S-box protein [Cyanobacteria bacterium P01_A01_bin.123]